MPWPTTNIPTSNLDSASDNAGNARADLLLAVQQINEMRALRDVAAVFPGKSANHVINPIESAVAWTGSSYLNPGQPSSSGFNFGSFGISVPESGWYEVTVTGAVVITNAGSGTYNIGTEALINGESFSSDEASNNNRYYSKDMLPPLPLNVGQWFTNTHVLRADSSGKEIVVYALVFGSGTSPTGTFYPRRIAIKRIASL